MRGLRSRVRRPAVLELGGLALLALAYNLIRADQGQDVAAAFRHAGVILELEGRVFDRVEAPLNGWMATAALVAVPACYFYAVAHYLATPAILVLSRRRGGWRYRHGYLTLVVASGIALIIYARYPVAPPRLLGTTEIVDVMRSFAHYGWWDSAASAPRGIGDATNQYAAMPSLHVGWSVWCGLQMWHFHGRWWKPLAIAYPALQILVVVGTGNHYLLDVVAGASLVLVTHYALRGFTSRVRDESAVTVEASGG
jgi:hypothetical protein